MNSPVTAENVIDALVDSKKSFTAFDVTKILRHLGENVGHRSDVRPAVHNAFENDLMGTFQRTNISLFGGVNVFHDPTEIPEDYDCDWFDVQSDSERDTLLAIAKGVSSPSSPSSPLSSSTVSNPKDAVKEVTDLVAELICEQLGMVWGVDRSDRIIEDLGADSFDCVELLMALEEEFEMEIADENAEKLLTVGEVMEYILKEKGLVGVSVPPVSPVPQIPDNTANLVLSTSLDAKTIRSLNDVRKKTFTLTSEGRLNIPTVLFKTLDLTDHLCQVGISEVSRFDSSGHPQPCMVIQSPRSGDTWRLVVDSAKRVRLNQRELAKVFDRTKNQFSIIYDNQTTPHAIYIY